MTEVVISPVGMQAPVVTSYVDYLHRSGLVGRPVIIIVATSNEKVMSQAALAKAAILYRFRTSKVRIVVTPSDDVDSDASLEGFFNTLAGELASITRMYNVESIYYNVTGGRKSMVVMGALFFVIVGRTTLSYVHNKNVDVVNNLLKGVEDKASKFRYGLGDDELLQLYIRYQGDLDQVMYPDPDTYTVLDIPIPPYPPNMIEFLDRVKMDGVPINDIASYGLSQGFINTLRRLGIVDLREGYVVKGRRMNIFDSIITLAASGGL